MDDDYPEVRGGDKVPVRSILATTKAQAQLRDLRPEMDVEDLVAPIINDTVRRFADRSPYYIAEREGLRLVFVVQKTKSLESGRFALVTVQSGWGKQ